MLPSLQASPGDRAADSLVAGLLRTQAVRPTPSPQHGREELIGSIVDVFSRLANCTSSVVMEIHDKDGSGVVLHQAGADAVSISEHCAARLRKGREGAAGEAMRASPAGDGQPAIVTETFREGRLLSGAMRIPGSEHGLAVASVLLAPEWGPLGREREETAFKALLFGIAEALVPRERTDPLQAEWSRSTIVDRCVPWGYVVVDEDGHVLFANHRAQAVLDSGNGIENRNGRLRAARSAIDRVLTSLIGVVAREGGRLPADETRMSRVIGIPSPDGDSRYALKLAPCDRCDATEIPAAYVFIIDLMAELKASHRDLASLFSLTEKESQFAGLFCGGNRLNDIAAMMGITANTARVHLHNLFKKTGTSSQVELAWKLARIL